jgi:hypothetical protein
MPYFVYHIVIDGETNKKQLTHLDTFDSYKDARTLARGKRAEGNLAANEEVRMIFAKNNVEAEKILSAPREERVIGED